MLARPTIDKEGTESFAGECRAIKWSPVDASDAVMPTRLHCEGSNGSRGDTKDTTRNASNDKERRQLNLTLSLTISGEEETKTYRS